MSDVINVHDLGIAGGYIIEAAMQRSIDQLKEENTKLRELVRDMHALATDHGVHVRYPYCDAWDEKLAVVEKQMRELGIEVSAWANA